MIDPREERDLLVTPVAKTGDPGFLASLEEMHDLHLLKSGGYGTTSDPFENFTRIAQVSGEPRHRYPRRRILEKIVRLESLDAQGREDELAEEYLDIAGLALCALSMLRSDRMAEPPIRLDESRFEMSDLDLGVGLSQ